MACLRQELFSWPDGSTEGEDIVSKAWSGDLKEEVLRLAANGKMTYAQIADHMMEKHPHLGDVSRSSISGLLSRSRPKAMSQRKLPPRRTGGWNTPPASAIKNMVSQPPQKIGIADVHPDDAATLGKTSLIDLMANECRYGISDLKRPDFRWCAADTGGLGPWCEKHAARCGGRQNTLNGDGFMAAAENTGAALDQEMHVNMGGEE